MVTKGIPECLEKRFGSRCHWGIYRDINEPKNYFMAARIYPRNGATTKHEWWMVVRPVEERLDQTEFQGRQAITVASFEPFDPCDNEPRTADTFFNPIAEELSTVKETEYALEDILYGTTRWARPELQKEIVETLFTTEWFANLDEEPYIVSHAADKKDFSEAATLANQYDKLCAGYLYKKKWNRILSGKGKLLVARPQQGSSSQRMPIVGYAGILSNKKAGKEKIYYLCSLVILPEFRRAGIATRLLRAASQYAGAPIVAHVPERYEEGLAFLAKYGTTSSLTKNMPELENVSWDAYRFEVPVS